MQPKILAVDDEEINLRLFRAIVERYLPEARLETAASGESCLQAVLKDPPNVVLLDARMPDMDGFEVCKRIKTDPATAHIPVLMVSGAYVETRHRMSGFEGGADGYVCKPFRTQELVAQIKALLQDTQEKEPSFRVMVVDDSRTSRQVIANEVKRNAYVEIAAFESVEAAKAAFDAVRPNLVVSDTDMEGSDGYSFCRWVRERNGYEVIPFVLLVENMDQASIEYAQQSGVTKVFPKPFKPFELSGFVDGQMESWRECVSHGILVVDPSRALRKVVADAVADLGLRVFEAGSAEEADRVMQKSPVDLIILADDLPGESGLAWCRDLRAREDRKWIPILVLASNGQPSEAFINAGADDYLSKDQIQQEVMVRAKNLLKRVFLTNQLQMAVQREKSLNEHRNRLLGIAAHDIRAPLTAISHYAQLLLDSPPADEEGVKARAGTIRQIADQALELVTGLLDVASVRNGVVDYHPADFRLDELLRDRLVFMNEIGRRKGIHGTLVNQMPPGTEAWVHGDRHRLTQVIDNLVSNAIKYSKPGAPFTLSISQEVEGWLVDVEDHGPGIPRDELLGVFDEFGITSVKASGGEKSTGLGLAIAKKLVELHGGTIWVESEVGKGTKVSFVIPGRPGEAEKAKE